MKNKHREIDEQHLELLQHLREVPSVEDIPMCYIYSGAPKKRRALLKKIHALGFLLEGALRELGMDARYNLDGDRYQAVPHPIRGEVEGNPPVPRIGHRYVIVSVCGLSIKVTFTILSGIYGLSPSVPIGSRFVLHKMRDIIVEEVVEYHMEVLQTINIEALIILLRKVEVLIKERMPSLKQCSTCRYVDTNIAYCGAGYDILTPNCSKWAAL